MKINRYRVLIVLLGVCIANVSQAVQQHFQINATKGRVVLSAPASVCGPAPSSGNKRSRTQFPVIPAGALMSQVNAPQSSQQNQLPNKTRANNQTSVAAAVKAGTVRAGRNSNLPQAAGTVSQPANSAQQQHSGAAVGPSNHPAPAASGTTTAPPSPVPQQ